LSGLTEHELILGKLELISDSLDQILSRQNKSEERTKELNEKRTEIKTSEDHRFVHLLNGQDKVIALVFNVPCRLSRLPTEKTN
jgi:hypothetical protein